MGWTYSRNWKTVEAVVKHLTDNPRVIAHELVPHSGEPQYILWSVFQTDEGNRFISCDLLDPFSGQWGYKDLCESMGPYYYSCPLRFLDMVPEVRCAQWRERVREYHSGKVATC